MFNIKNNCNRTTDTASVPKQIPLNHKHVNEILLLLISSQSSNFQLFTNYYEVNEQKENLRINVKTKIVL